MCHINKCTTTDLNVAYLCGANAACKNFIATESAMPYLCNPCESGYGGCAYSDCNPSNRDGEDDVEACKVL